MQIAINILSNRLFEKVRSKRGLVCQVYTSLDKVSSNDGILYLTTQEPSAAMEVIFLEVGRLRNELVEAKVLQDTIAISINDYYLSKGSVSTQASMLGRYELNGSGWEDYLRTEDKMKAVTPENIMEVAREYLENINFGILGDPGKIDRELFLS
jgi:predicted Zn-dependent peptidase